MATRSPDLVGRDRLLNRLVGLVDRTLDGQRVTALVSGQAGIGKTSLLRAAAASAASHGAQVGWGTCLDVDGAPGYWPWTQLLTALARSLGTAGARALAGDDVSLLAAIAPFFGEPSAPEPSDRTRLLLLDAAVRWIDAVAATAPVVVVLDDLQWADESSLALLDFLARAPHGAPVCLLGAYREDELSRSARQCLGGVAARGEHLTVEGLDAESVHELVCRVAGGPLDRELTATIHRRSGGHPLFVRELALLAPGSPGAVEAVPTVVREVIEQRLARLPPDTRAVLEVAAVAGREVVLDVAAAALGRKPAEIEAAARPAEAAAFLSLADDRLSFVHDLPREVILSGIHPTRRVALHQAIGTALDDRRARAGDVTAAELARHYTRALPLDGTTRATRWALAAAAADRSALAFAEAASHLRRLRTAVATAGAVLESEALVDVLLAEADCLARAGVPLDARGLLRLARDCAHRAGDVRRTATVALATARLGARFAVRRDEVVDELEGALELVTDTDPELEAHLTATLARELSHSVPEDRPRSGPLSERALELGRRSGSPSALAACLLARHDVLWNPGRGPERAEVAGELVAVARRAGDDERQAEGLLLLANALLEGGSGGFEAALESCLVILDRLGQPRHRYTAETRRACLALLRGQLEVAGGLIESAAHLGERIREPDAGNVRMSQRLELVRAAGQPDELRAFASEAVAHWTGAPVHANAVAAGFSARAGDLDEARRHVGVVVDLGSWQVDRSYLWSVFVRELAHAAIALSDRELCARLLDDVAPLADSCGVNGAVVAFAGSHAHVAALLAGELDDPGGSRRLLDRALVAYQRLGATGWIVEVRALLDAAPALLPSGASMRRSGSVWHIAFAGRQATVAHRKGLADIAALLAAPGSDVHVLDLIDSPDRRAAGADLVDRATLAAYRRRLADLDEEAAEAADHNDGERVARLESERQALLDELGRVTGIGGRPRQFANHPAERARKAIAARMRDAIRQLAADLPELAAHLEGAIVTGNYCRYRPPDHMAWDLGPAAEETRGESTPGNSPGRGNTTG